MRLSFIGKLIEKGWLSPAEGRLMEALVFMAVASLATYGYEWISSSIGTESLGSFAPVVVAVAGPVLQALAKRSRDAAKISCE